jgi:hypothetical protein
MKRIASVVAVAAMLVGGVSSAFAQTRLDDSQLDNVTAGILNGNFNFSPVRVKQNALAQSYQSQIALIGIQYAENTAKNKSCVDVYVDQTNVDVLDLF